MNPIERLRRKWTPEREATEVLLALDPQSELDSMVRDFLHRIIEQSTGPVTLLLGVGDIPKLNTGMLRWEIVHHEPTPGSPGRREVTLWVEGAENGRTS